MLLHEAYWQKFVNIHAAASSPWLDDNQTANGETIYPITCGQAFLKTGVDGSLTSQIRIDGEPVQPLGGPAGKLVRRILNTGDNRFTIARNDEFGFNNPEKQWREGNTAAIVLGDSFAYGAEVERGKGMADLIRKELGQTVNLACGGNGPLLTLAGLREYGPYLKPKTVFWFYFEGNDLTKDIVRERNSETLMNYLNDGFTQNLLLRRQATDAETLDYLDRFKPRAPDRPAPHQTERPLSWWNMMRLLGLRSALGMGYEFSPESLALFRRVLIRARDLAASWQARFVFVYLPGEVRFTSPTAMWDADGYRQAVLDVVRAADIETVDATPVFAARAQPRDLYRGHFTAEGHRIVTDHVLKSIGKK